MSSSGDNAVLHDMMKPLAWILGKWKSESGRVIYPTMEDVNYTEELTFSHIGKPNIQFSMGTWHAEKKFPMHSEGGFVRIKEGTNHVAYLSTHNIGLTEISEGEVNRQELTLKSISIDRMSFANPPETLKINRTFRLQGDILEQVVDMETSKTPLTEHLRVTYKKVTT